MLTLDDIAAKYRVKPGAVYAQAARDKWTDARNERAKILLEKVREKSVLNAVEELSQYNTEDLLAAKKIRVLAAKHMLNPKIEPKDVRSLAGAVESAQRIARLALGASTENTETRMTEVERMTPQERREELRRLHAELFPNDTSDPIRVQ
jgi:hypothetical protein